MKKRQKQQNDNNLIVVCEVRYYNVRSMFLTGKTARVSGK